LGIKATSPDRQGTSHRHRRHHLHLRFHYCSVTSSSLRRPFSLPPRRAASRRSSSYSLRSLPPSLRPPSPLSFSLVDAPSSCGSSSSSLSSAARRDDDQTSAITLLLFASPLLFLVPLPITLFLLLSALLAESPACYRRSREGRRVGGEGRGGESERSSQLQSGAKQSREARQRPLRRRRRRRGFEARATR
jgi:hypothetical protein